MSQSASSLSGAILAGGESRRMGSDKALLEVGGVPLWKRQSGILREAGCGEVFVVRRPGQPDLDPTLPHVRDRVAGAGPLAGLHAALLEAKAPLLAVLAVDMPAIEARWFLDLLRHCGPATGAVSQQPEGHFEPLAAIYPVEPTLPAVERRISNGLFSLQDLLKELVAAGTMKVVPLAAADRPQTANWNAPGDLQNFG